MLINFYSVCRKKFKDLQEKVQTTLHSEVTFSKARDIYCGRLQANDVEKAWALWVMANECHAGSLYGGWKFCNGMAGTHFGKVFKNKRDSFNHQLYERLSEVQISCRDALKVIKNKDGPETFFYLDPPYPGAVQGHYYGYTEKDLADLLTILSKLKGRFILSNYWTDTLRSAVESNGWKYKEIKVTTHTAANTNKHESTEVLVFNYEIERTLF